MESQLAYSIAEACAAARIGRTTLYEAIRNGSLRAVKRGARTLILARDLRDWIERLPAKIFDHAERGPSATEPNNRAQDGSAKLEGPHTGVKRAS
jgi:excisionase family DNA binding protein